MTMILNRSPNTYNMNYDVATSLQNIKDLDNKLFCTFTDLDNLDNLLEEIQSKYTIIYNVAINRVVVSNDIVLFK